MSEEKRSISPLGPDSSLEKGGAGEPHVVVADNK